MDPQELQAIILDFDGVLVESADIKTRAFAELYAPFGEAVAEAVVAYHVANPGVSRYRKFRYAQEQLLGRPPLSESEERELDRRFSDLVVEQVVRAPAVPGAEALLHRRAPGTSLFVASGTPEAELQAIVERRGLREYFNGVYGAPAGKQAIIAGILARHELEPARVVMIGDAPSDLEGARTNAVPFIGRVAAGSPSPFPADVLTVPDLTDIERQFEGL